MLARIRLFRNFCTIIKERDETRRTKYCRIISQFSRDQLLLTNLLKEGRTFRASTSIISCVRERTFYAICVVDDDRYFKNTKSFASLQDRQEKFCRHAIYGGGEQRNTRSGEVNIFHLKYLPKPVIRVFLVL